MKSKIVTIVIVVVLAFVSILGVLSFTGSAKNISLDNRELSDLSEKETNKIKESLTKEEKLLLARYVFRQKLSGSEPASDVGAAIEEQRQVEAKAKAAKAQRQEEELQALKAHEENQLKLSSRFKIEAIEKGFKKADYRDYNTIRTSLINADDKTIRAMEYRLIFSDLFGDHIATFKIKETASVPKNKELLSTYMFRYNSFEDSHAKFRNTRLEDMKLEVDIQTIIFSDGTKEIY